MSNLTLTACYSSFTDEFGKEHPEHKDSFAPEITPGFGLHSTCYIIIRNGLGKYYVQEAMVDSVWYTNLWGWRMVDGRCFTADEYGKKVFSHNELSKAIETCLEYNNKRKVKVKYL